MVCANFSRGIGWMIIFELSLINNNGFRNFGWFFLPNKSLSAGLGISVGILWQLHISSPALHVGI